MNVYHPTLTKGRWETLSFTERLANIGSEVERSLNWQNKGNSEYSQHAFERALELLDLTLDGTLTTPQRSELSKLREVLIDYFQGTNLYQSRPELWQKYFRAFTYAAQLKRTA